MPVLKGLLAPLKFIAVAAVLLLAPAGIVGGAWAWPRAWGFLAVFGVASLAGSVTLAVVAPASFAVRQQGLVAARAKGQPLADAAGSIAYAFYMAAWFAFIPIDVFRLQLLPAPSAALSAMGAAATIAGVVVAYAALARTGSPRRPSTTRRPTGKS